MPRVVQAELSRIADYFPLQSLVNQGKIRREILVEIVKGLFVKILAVLVGDGRELDRSGKPLSCRISVHWHLDDSNTFHLQRIKSPWLVCICGMIAAIADNITTIAMSGLFHGVILDRILVNHAVLHNQREGASGPTARVTLSSLHFQCPIANRYKSLFGLIKSSGLTTPPDPVAALCYSA